MTFTDITRWWLVIVAVATVLVVLADWAAMAWL
jgi:hypothetical protein